MIMIMRPSPRDESLQAETKMSGTLARYSHERMRILQDTSLCLSFFLLLFLLLLRWGAQGRIPMLFVHGKTPQTRDVSTWIAPSARSTAASMLQPRDCADVRSLTKHLLLPHPVLPFFLLN